MSNITPEPPSTNDYRKILYDKNLFQGNYTLSVSVVIPFYKGRWILARTLASLVKQNYPSHLIEVIVSDDGSPEPVHEVLELFQKDLHLHYIRQEDLGYRPATARNHGIDCATGEIILSLDFDMICSPDFIQAHLAWFHVSDRVATIGPRQSVDASTISVKDVISDFEIIRNLPPCRSTANRKRWKDGQMTLEIEDIRIPSFQTFYLNTVPEKSFHSGNIAYRRDHALALHGFDEDYNYNYGCEDIDFGYRLHRVGVFLVAELQALTYHQVNHLTSLQGKIVGERKNLAKLLQKFPELRTRWGLIDPGKDNLDVQWYSPTKERIDSDD